MELLDRAGRRPKAMPYQKYRSFSPVDLPNRTWPNRTLHHAPRWCSVDLRDGNQALIDPMNVEEKHRMFELLLDVGLVEIEVGFPSASQPDFKFLRSIVDQNLIPDDVIVQVLCQARPELIHRTLEAMEGVKRGIFHLYNSTSSLQRRVVFNMDRGEIVDLAVSGVELVKQGLKDVVDSDIVLEYSPESFTATELDFAVEVCDAVAAAWGATPERKMIVNLPSTVEMATPNIYADQIEWFCRNFRHRESAVVSLHTHNDRGTGVAATELGLMAGAERVEGTLFGNGERTGNCDLVAVAMNLFSQGVDPELDLRDMPRIRETVEAVNKIPVHIRHPYAGELVFTAFSGSHQDAIRKGMSVVSRERWEVPYLPIDPADVGSSYRESVRVNSQSGKSGVGFILEEYFGVSLPRDMLVEFSRVVQRLTEDLDREVKPPEIFRALLKSYRDDQEPYRLNHHEVEASDDGECFLRAEVTVATSTLKIEGMGANPILAFAEALSGSLNEPVEIVESSIHRVLSADDETAHDYFLGVVAVVGADGTTYGVGYASDATNAQLDSVISSLNRRWRGTAALRPLAAGSAASAS